MVQILQDSETDRNLTRMFENGNVVVGGLSVCVQHADYNSGSIV